MDLSTATWEEIETLETALAVLPVGSTEQHGPHAPLGTDVCTAEAVADAAIQRFDRPVVRAPAIPVGIAAEHRHFAGTLWVEPDTFRSYIRDCLESLASHGFDRIVVVNGHGGNVDALEEVTAEVTRAGICDAVTFTWFDAIGDERADLGHGGPIETAMLQSVDPTLIREDRIEAAHTEGAERWGTWVGGTNIAHDTREFSESGAVGDPAMGDADRGAALLETAAEALVEVLTAVAER
ncbi:MAG: creatininase family protein [Natrialbaceae archaeon]|nr:creatininase family protein [Natrialbaceae archaeon]